jgi:hypothetical protein
MPASYGWKASFQSCVISRIEADDAKAGSKLKILRARQCYGFRMELGEAVRCSRKGSRCYGERGTTVRGTGELIPTQLEEQGERGKGTTPKKDTSESSLKLPPEMVDVTSQHLGKIFAIVGISPSKPKE